MLHLIGWLFPSVNPPPPAKPDPVEQFGQQIVEAQKAYKTALQPELVQAALHHFQQDVEAKNFTAQRLMGDVVTKTAAYHRVSKSLGYALFDATPKAQLFAAQETVSFYRTSRTFALWLSTLSEKSPVHLDDHQLEQWMTQFTSVAITRSSDGVAEMMQSYQAKIGKHLGLSVDQNN